MEIHTTRTTRYFCPYCGKSQWLFSLRPVSKDEWNCSKCGHPFLLDTKAIMHSWLGTITFWALLPLAILLGAFFIAVTKPDKLILALLIGVPVTAVVCDVVLYVLCIPIAWLRARSIKSKSETGTRRLKMVVREVS